MREGGKGGKDRPRRSSKHVMEGKRAGRVKRRTRTAARPILLMPATFSAAGAAGIYVIVGPGEGRAWLRLHLSNRLGSGSEHRIRWRYLISCWKHFIKCCSFSFGARLVRTRIDLVLDEGIFGLPLKPLLIFSFLAGGLNWQQYRLVDAYSISCLLSQYLISLAVCRRVFPCMSSTK